MKKAILKGCILIAVVLTTSFSVAGDTTRPRRGILSNIERAYRNMINEFKSRKAKRSVPIGLMEYRVEQNDILIDSLMQLNKIDSLKKQ